MTRSHLLQAVAVICCVAAAYISYNLLLKHVNGSSGVAWFDSACKDSAGGGSADCDAVLASPYAYWPPKHDPDSRKLHIPVAFLGLVYFSTLGVWLFGVGSPSVERRWLHIVPLAMVVMGLLSSANFLYIMFSKLDQWCPWCLVTHILNVMIVVSVFLLFPKDRTKGVAQSRQDTPEPTAAPEAVAHPTLRIVSTTILAMVLVLYGENQMQARQTATKAALSYQSNYNRCVQAIQRIQKNGRTLLVDWEDAPRHDIAVRSDDPVRQPNPKGDAWNLVVFSDFECPSCQRFAMFLDHKIQPLFDGRLRVIFKHYPLNPACNGRVRFPTHPHACYAAKIAEGTRLVGGNAAFWKAHDYLFRHRDMIRAGRMTPEAVATAVGLDPQKLKDAMTSSDIQTRLDEDSAQAGKCGLTGTPGVYVNGKHVDTLATMQITFWDTLADRYWQAVQQPRPTQTKLRNRNATPGTPVPVVGP